MASWRECSRSNRARLSHARWRLGTSLETLEQALEFIDDGELVEVTPVAIRLRKQARTEVDRKRGMRA